jgi:uncharacterized protein
MINLAGTAPEMRGEETAWFDFCRQERLMLQRCADCGDRIFYPRSVCPRCLGGQLEWEQADGAGVVLTYTVQHRPPPEFGPEPYAVAIVELAEGVRIFSRIVADPARVHIGMAVRVAFAQLPDGFTFPVFMEA